MNFYQHPDAFFAVRNLYWFLRAGRMHDLARRRRYYRKIKVEKEKLLALGYLPEHLRLYCRYMARPLADCRALDQLKAFELAMTELDRFYSRKPVVLPGKVPSLIEHTTRGIRLRAASEPGTRDVVPRVIEPLRTVDAW